MDTVRDAIMLMRSDCYLASIDFKHAYYSVNVHPKDRKYLCFEWRNKLYCFCALPQGLRSAPRTFTKLLKPAFATLREQGVTTLGYIDDSLFVADTKQDIGSAISMAVELFDGLGLTIHPVKSVLHPVKVIEFLGFILDSRNMTVALTQRKKDKIERLGRALLRRKNVSIQELSEFIGNVVAADQGVEYAVLHYKGLEIERNRALKKAFGNYTNMMTLSDTGREDVQWWLDNIQTAQKCISQRVVTFVTESDASLKGWGASVDGASTGGDWTTEEMEFSINWLELKAAFLTLQTFCAQMRDTHIRLMIDNTTAVACINKMASTKPHLFQLVRQVTEWAIERNLTLSAAHIPGRLNVVADRESRTQNLDTEWMLETSVFQQLCEIFGTPEIDLFASRINHQLDKYVSWRPDPGAAHIDAFHMSWSHTYGYAFPPFSMIPHTLRKLDADGSLLLVVLPAWPTRAWYTQVQPRLVARPVLLPRHVLRLPQKRGEHHRLDKKLRLFACLLLGRNTNWRAYPPRLLNSCFKLGAKAPDYNTRCICRSGFHFVKQKKFLCFTQL